MQILEIVTPTGAAKSISIGKFPAIEGWKLQEQFIRFAVSDDLIFKRNYVFEVLSYCKVVQEDGGNLPLSTDALVNNHIGSWDNVRRVFEQTLIYNGIDPKTHAKQLHYWAASGEQMAASFMSEVFTSQLVQDVARKQNGKLYQFGR